MLQLGSELVSALGSPAEHDLLANWMARHLAEKLALEKVARGTAKKQLSDECAELILKLWAHRQSMPDGTRPFGSFEPMFRLLQDLASEQPRNSYLRAVPPKVKVSKEIEELISLAATIDGAANTLIRYVLARVVAQIPASDKRWANLRAAMKPSHWDIRVVFQAMDEAEKLIDEKQKLKDAEIKEVNGLLAGLKVFQELALVVQDHFEKRLSGLQSGM